MPNNEREVRAEPRSSKRLFWHVNEVRALQQKTVLLEQPTLGLHPIHDALHWLRLVQSS